MKLEFTLTVRSHEPNKYYQLSNSPHHINNGALWINNESGEGGTFNYEDFYKLIDNFFKENL